LSDELAESRTTADAPLRELELWDLVSAFGRLMREHRPESGSSIVYDDTPIQVFMERIEARLRTSGRAEFSEFFEAGAHRSTLIGLFLALLELVRHHGVRVEQGDAFGTIWIVPAAG
jgi:segregation and condensation protein A